MKCPSCNEVYKSYTAVSLHFRKNHGTSDELFEIMRLKYVAEHHNGVEPICECGCGKIPKYCGYDAGYSKFAPGHQSRVHNNWGHNDAAQKKSQATRREMWDNGEIKAWCSGLTKEDPRVAEIIKKMNTPERAKKISEALSGKQKSEDHKQKIAVLMKDYWSKEENRSRQSKRQAECVKNGMLTKATRVHGYLENPKKSVKKVYYRSLFELNAFLHMEASNEIVSYVVEPYRIEYEFEGKIRNYVIDCEVEYKDGRKVLIEFKPSCYLGYTKNEAKFEAARSFASGRGLEFEIWTEKSHSFLQAAHTP